MPGIFLVLFSFSCGTFHLKKDLSPEHKEFLSKVRYIITKKEKKVFLNLPPSEEEAFIQDFWKKRDPNPDTEENEFKIEYFERIKEANHLFDEGATEGWLEDRGRIYILLGPPENREVYPTGYTFYDSPMEVWYYGTYPIIFVDKFYSGDYELYPGSAQNLANLLTAQMELKPDVQMDEVTFDFNLELKDFPSNLIKITIKIPYENIFFKEEENKLQTTLFLHLKVFSKSKKIWDFKENYSIYLASDKLRDTVGKEYVIQMEKELQPGKYRATIYLENKTDNKKVEKNIKFKLKKKGKDE